MKKRFEPFFEMFAGEKRSYITPPRGAIFLIHLVIVLSLPLLFMLFSTILALVSAFLCLLLFYWICIGYKLWKIYYARAFFFLFLLLDLAAACLLKYILTAGISFLIKS